MPGYFRFLTLMAFHVFLQEKVCVATSPKTLCSRPWEGESRQAKGSHAASGAPVPPAMPSDLLQVDLAVVEVGIVGAYDCTNIIR